MPSSSSLLTATIGLLASHAAAQSAWISPEYTEIFQHPLPIPPVKQPALSVTNETTGRTVDFYEFTITSFQQQTYPNLGPTTYTGYDGIAPGPTIWATRGREAVVRFINNYDRPSSVHLHGSFSRSPFDGWAADYIDPGEFKDYYWPNAQPERTLWYHDHAAPITAQNAGTGQVGLYILDDPNVDFGLPTGDYDVPLIIASRQFNSDASIAHPGNAAGPLTGDVITVNGQPWPVMNVEPRRYRFRLLDASMSRTFNLYLADQTNTTRIPMTVVSADSGYLSSSVQTDDLTISMGERYDVVIDFSEFAGQNVTLGNTQFFQGAAAYPATDRVLRFVVGNDVTDNTNNDAPPAQLADLPVEEDNPVVTREFTFSVVNGEWLINGQGFHDVADRIIAEPQRGTVERWRLTNPSPANHPLHIHLVDFQILNRTGGSGQVTAYEQAALKDIAYVGRGETIDVLANFAPWPGVYMFHCHNLIHEDNDMMVAFNVTVTPEQLEELGYGDAALLDPEAAAFAAEPYQGTDLNEVRDETIPGFLALNAYPEIVRVAAAQWVPAEEAPPEKRDASPASLTQVRRSVFPIN